MHWRDPRSTIGPNRRSIATLALAVAAGVAGVASVVPAQASPAWRQNPVWDDGKAEFCAYEIDWRRYGRSNPGRALLIAVKEPWAPDLEVKADLERPDGFEVIKLNHVRDVATGIYTYHQMASAFVVRESGQLRKLAVTSSEACGISTAELIGDRLETRSYFDGEGERAQRLASDTLAFDALPLVLRDYLDGAAPESLEILPSLMTGRFSDLAARRYRLERGRGRREVPAGVFETIEIELEAGADRLQFSFEVESPHPLVRFEDSEGTVYRLAKCGRIAYWTMNGPGGETWLPEAVR